MALRKTKAMRRRTRRAAAKRRTAEKRLSCLARNDASGVRGRKLPTRGCVSGDRGSAVLRPDEAKGEASVGAGLDCDQCGELARNIGCRTSPASYEAKEKKASAAFRRREFRPRRPSRREEPQRASSLQRHPRRSLGGKRCRSLSSPENLTFSRPNSDCATTGKDPSVPARRGAGKALSPSVGRHLAGSGGGACNRARAAAATASAPRNAMASRQAPLAPPRPAKAPES
jgi:hypothetical protein